MKSLRLLVCTLPFMLAGCSTLSAVNWSAAYPWNWFGSSAEITEQGVAGLDGSTPMDEQAMSDALGSDYHLRSGMKMHNGNIVHYYEVLHGDTVAMIINGDKGTISRIDVLDNQISTDNDVRVGTIFSDLYDKAYGHCETAVVEEHNVVECKAKESTHIHYQFAGSWQGPQELMPPDDMLKNWAVSKIIWQR